MDPRNQLITEALERLANTIKGMTILHHWNMLGTFHGGLDSALEKLNKAYADLMIQPPPPPED